MNKVRPAAGGFATIVDQEAGVAVPCVITKVSEQTVNVKLLLLSDRGGTFLGRSGEFLTERSGFSWEGRSLVTMEAIPFVMREDGVGLCGAGRFPRSFLVVGKAVTWIPAGSIVAGTYLPQIDQEGARANSYDSARMVAHSENEAMRRDAESVAHSAALRAAVSEANLRGASALTSALRVGPSVSGFAPAWPSGLLSGEPDDAHDLF